MFCGRDKDIQQVLDHCKAGRLVVVSAQPGLGNTVLLESGIEPALRAEGFITVVFREWQGRSFATQLAQLIADRVRALADDTFFAQTETLPEMLARIRHRTGRPVALLLDQFEDYVRCQAGTHMSDSFDADLSHAIGNHECQVVIALQEHALEAFRRFEQYVPNLMGSHVTLGPLDEAAARELVAGAGKEKGIEFEPEAIDALVKAPVVSKGGVHPFYLMTGVQRLIDAGLEKTWSAATAGMIEIYGGADRLILESLDPKLSKLTPTQIDLFFRWCRLFLSKDDERLAASSEALTDYAGKLNRFALTLLPILLEEGILRTVEMPETMRYEIARDSLTRMVRDWWQRREAMLIARRRARFRIRSVSLAVGSIAALYVVWLILSLRK